MIEEVKKMTEILTLKAEGQAEAQGAAMVINALFQADAQSEGQSRTEKHVTEKQTKNDVQRQTEAQQTSQQTSMEAATIAQGQGVDPQTMSVPDFILLVTRRLNNLAKHDPEDFKIRMLSMKNSNPSLYQEVYKNLKEMNVIAADTMPDLAQVQENTPGEIPQFAQGDTSGDTPASPVEQGASSPGSSPVVAKPNTRPLPVSQPPQGANASV